MNETVPAVRKDLQFIPVQQGGHQLIFIQDHLGLAQEGRPISLLYRVMALLDGTSTINDLQMELMSQKGVVDSSQNIPFMLHVYYVNILKEAGNETEYNAQS